MKLKMNNYIYPTKDGWSNFAEAFLTLSCFGFLDVGTLG